MMVKPQQFDIILGSPRAVYKAGSVVTGSLILHAEQPQLYTSLGLKVSGKGRVNFSQSAVGGRGRERLTNKECYIKRDVRLLPRGFGSMANETMEQGHHEFPFTFKLPASVPSSYECPYGSVRYCVKAKLELGWADSLSVRKYFVVFKPFDLNDDNSARCSEEQEVERPMCCLPCSPTHNMAARASIPKRGYVPGETIHVQWEVRNIWFRKIYFTIEEVSFCRASDMTAEASEILKTHTPVAQAPAHSDGDDSGSNGTRSGLETITVPVAVPSGLDSARIIDLEHRLVLHVVSLSPACSLKIPLNIMIGTSPLASTHYDSQEEYEREEEEELPPPDYDSGYSNSQESLPRGGGSTSSGQAIMGIQPPAYSPSPTAVSSNGQAHRDRLIVQTQRAAAAQMETPTARIEMSTMETETLPGTPMETILQTETATAQAETATVLRETRQPEVATVPTDTVTVQMETATAQAETATVLRETRQPEVATVPTETVTVQMETATAQAETATAQAETATRQPEGATVPTDTVTVQMETPPSQMETQSAETETETQTAAQQTETLTAEMETVPQAEMETPPTEAETATVAQMETPIAEMEMPISEVETLNDGDGNTQAEMETGTKNDSGNVSR